MNQRIAIIGGLRTPFIKAGGALGQMHADDLGALVVRELLARCQHDLPPIDEVVFGNVAQPAHAANIGRVIALKAGLPADVIAHTVHRNCASGMQAVTTAALQLRAGEAEIIIAGGTESMSQIPLLFGARMTEFFIRLMRARSLRQRVGTLASFRMAHLKPVIALQLGLTDPICGLNMGETAEILAAEFGISRSEQDAYALESHRKAAAALESGRFNEEILPVVAAPRFDTVVHADDGPDGEMTIEGLRRRRPYFDRDAGTVTAGNTCPITDGAVALLLCTEKKARQMGVTPLGFLSHWTYAALDGQRMGLGPVYAAAKLAERTGLTVDDFDVIELNEAFAAQSIANLRAFECDRFAQEYLGRKKALGAIDPDRFNVNGGAIALGHPVGATGARLVLSILHELRHRGAKRGLATLCVGGGQGAALVLEAA